MQPSHHRPPSLVHLCLSLLLLFLLPLSSLSLSPPPPPSPSLGESDSTTTSATIGRLLHSAAAFRYGLPPDHTFDPSLFYRPSFTASSPSLFSASSSSPLFSLTPSISPFSSSPRGPAPRQSISAAVALYQQAAALNSSFALLSLAEIGLFGEGSSTVDVTGAVPLLQSAAALGSARAQHLLALLHHTGIGVPRSSAHSLLNHYFAALSGDPLSLMAMGWRHLVGDGVPRSCEAAVGYYHRVARRVVREIEADSVSQILEKVRLQGEDGGEGMRSVISDQVEEDILLYYKQSAERGDTSAQLALANVLYYGTHGLSTDYATAAHYFTQAAAAGDVQAKTQLAFMQAHGVGLPRDPAAAFHLLESIVAAAQQAPPRAFNLLGRA